MADPIPAWPGELVPLDIGDVYVRAAPALADAEPALFVHGLGGSSRNWTDIMDLLSRGADPDDADPAEAGQADAAQADAGSVLAAPVLAAPVLAAPVLAAPVLAAPVLAAPVLATPVLATPVLAGEALDLPGFGHSPRPVSGDYSIAARAAAVIELIDKRGQWPVHLIGNSLGGSVCTRVAAQRPDLVRTLTLISPAMPDLRPRLLPLRVVIATAPWLGRWLIRRLEAVPAEYRTTATIRDVFADPSLMHPSRVREEIAEVIRRDGLGYQTEVLIKSARALVAEYLRFGPRTLWHDAARVTAPTLVIHGSLDRLVNPVMARRAARVFRSAHVVVLPRIGHVAMMERPELVARLMREFLTLAERDRARAPGAGPPVTAGSPAAASAPAATGLNQVSN